MNRKGLSKAITSILILMITVIALSILSYFIFQFLKKPEFAPGFSCLDMQFNPTIRLDNVCYDENKKDINVRIFRDNEDFDFSNLYLILNFKGGNSKIYYCGEDCEQCSILKKGASKEYYLGNFDSYKEGEVLLKIFDCIVDKKEINKC